MPSKLSNAITYEDWPEAIHLVKQDPQLARKRYVLPVFLNEQWKGPVDIYPLQHCCSVSSVPLELIRILLFAYPGAILKSESGIGRQCLHIALLSSLPNHIISFLLQEHPDVASEQDKIGRVPLHYACSNLRDKTIIGQLVSACPQAIRAPDWKGWTPLHVAVATKDVCTPLEIIHLLVSACPGAVPMCTNSGSNTVDLVREKVVTHDDCHHRDETISILQNMDQSSMNTFYQVNFKEAMQKKQMPHKKHSSCFV